MERPKKTRLKDKDMNDRFEQVYQDGMGNPVILSAAPTKPADMKANTMGYYGDKLYIRFANGKLQQFDGTEIT